jgi:hypothetical protein
MSTADVPGLPVGDLSLEQFSALRLWVLAVATYVVGDVATTTAVLRLSDLHREANPVVRTVLESAGTGGFLAAKLAITLGCVWVSVRGFQARKVDELTAYGPPVLLATIGVVATLHNLRILVAIT